ncbi:hypothetical protein EVAR_14134_1 [Eumeta japonica]|uniref:Uncharacterized protein n=1 Tax=Eumeta variegata TaxID=151549 RepID=A0A4C1UEC2_EUMVA|nr:hypothetical protein EVAR_14134_1 [Eumeta japonica]
MVKGGSSSTSVRDRNCHQDLEPNQERCVRPLSLFYSDIGRWSGREIARSALSLARSAQAERDNESCFFVRAAGVHRFIRRYHVKNIFEEL